MTIGLLIPTYNTEKELQHLLDSVIKINFFQKILIIDSSSRDKTINILDQ